MSAVLSGTVSLQAFDLVPEVHAGGPWNSSKPPKYWAVPQGFNFGAYGPAIVDYGSFVVFQLSYPTGAGVKQLSAMMVPKADCFVTNVPPSPLPVGVALQAPYSTPVDPSKWDAVNYYLVPNAAGMGTPNVADHRNDAALPVQFSQADRLLACRRFIHW